MSSAVSAPTAGPSDPAATPAVVPVTSVVPPVSLSASLQASFASFLKSIQAFGETPYHMQSGVIPMMLHDVAKIQDITCRMIKAQEFLEEELPCLTSLANQILDSSKLSNGHFSPLLKAMGDVRKSLKDLDTLRPPVSAPSPIEEPAVSDLPAITPAAEEDLAFRFLLTYVYLQVAAPLVGESSKVKGKCRDEGCIMDKKCITCQSKGKEGADSATAPPPVHVPIIQLTARSPATLPVIPGYLTTNAPNTSTHLRMELELAQACNTELEEDVIQLCDGLRAAERALQRTHKTAAHEREIFRACIDALGGAASLQD
ncbi:hypothetical protein BYT27DRAFT_7251571 [Phlegmacium glaucopus]|nr:hypothetical protein BYT27DRAFT_7251571 [Phlegmacium glaucopus]